MTVIRERCAIWGSSKHGNIRITWSPYYRNFHKATILATATHCHDNNGFCRDTLSGPGFRLAETLVHIDRVSDEGAGRRKRQSRRGAPAVRTSPNTCCASVTSARLWSSAASVILTAVWRGMRRVCWNSCVPCKENSFCVVVCLSVWMFYEKLVALTKDASVMTRLSLIRRK